MNMEEQTMSLGQKSPVTLGGTAKDAKDGPALGLVDIGTSDRAYIFRVALPGVRRNGCNLKIDVQIDGRVDIQGLVTNSERVKACASKYEMKVQELAPPGRFSLSFNLPGRVDPRLVSPNFKNDGILEVVVMKHHIPHSKVNNSWASPS